MTIRLQADALHQAILAAHAAGDGIALSRLYAQAAQDSAQAGKRDESSFFLTQAFVFALEEGLPDADRHAAELRARGRL